MNDMTNLFSGCSITSSDAITASINNRWNDTYNSFIDYNNNQINLLKEKHQADLDVLRNQIFMVEHMLYDSNEKIKELSKICARTNTSLNGLIAANQVAEFNMNNKVTN